MPGAFPFGTLGSTTPTSTVSSLLDLSEVDIPRSGSAFTGDIPNGTGNELGTHSARPPITSTTKGSTFSFMSDLDEESANLPIGLVERASEPRSGVMSPAPADPLARVPLPVIPRGPNTRSNGNNSSSQFEIPPASRTTEPSKRQSLENGSMEKSKASTTSERRVGSVNTSAAYSNQDSDLPSQPQEFQISTPRTDAPAKPSNGQPSPPRDGIEKVADQTMSSGTAHAIEKKTRNGTWELLPNDMFTHFSAGKKVLREQEDPPSNEWIWSRTGWHGQPRMYWAMIQSGARK